MLPPISSINYIEMIRDGGSLEASFVGSNGSKYCLHFGVIIETNAQGQRARAGYAKPIVFERLEFQNGESRGWQPNNEVEVSWEHALSLLHQFRSHVRDANDVKWLDIMEEVASTAGSLPTSLQDARQTIRPAVGDG